MNEHAERSFHSFCLVLCVIAIAWAATKGCATVYDPKSITADAEARIKMHDAFKNDPIPSPSPKQ
jgi:hypothetical protein